jgi:chemotaxis protein methyltransferase CheR
MTPSITESSVLTMKDLRRIQEIIYRHCGIRLPDTKQEMVQGRLRRRLQASSMNSYPAYLDWIASPAGKNEFTHFIDSLTTNETYFFRHKEHWDHLLGIAVPEWLKHNPAGPLVRFRAWSAACSSGEETYSLAIGLSNVLADAGRPDQYQVTATDISTRVLEAAAAAHYREYSLQKVTPYCREQFFTVRGDGWAVLPEVRRHIEFMHHNLMNAPSFPPVDVVMLRNVMIYFDDASKKVVMDHVTRKLKPGGYLYLGGSEVLPCCHEFYTTIQPTIYRKNITSPKT